MINSPIPRIGGKRLLRNKICDRLALKLSQIQGKFLLSYNDDMFIRDLYRDYDIVSVSRNNNLSSGSFKELLIRNY